VEHKNSKKCNEMYYPRFTKVIIYHFMSKDPFIPRRNNVNWHYVRDDHMFSTIKLVSRHQNMQQFHALPKASDRRTRSSSNTYITLATAPGGPRLITSAKGKQAAKASKAKSLSALFEVAMTEAQQLKLVTKRSLQQTHISQASGFGADEGTSSIPGVPDEVVRDDDKDDGKDDEEEGGDDEQEYDEETRDGESFDPIPKTPKNSDDEGNGDEDLRLNVGGEEGHVEEEEEDEL
nr:hypothetical protein [Tanacetum cinerariifolium]